MRPIDPSFVLAPATRREPLRAVRAALAMCHAAPWLDAEVPA